MTYKFQETNITITPKHWSVKTIEEACDKIIDYRGKTPHKTTSGVPLITAKIVKGGRILEPQEFISEVDYDEWMSRGLPEEGDIVVTTEAPLGEVAQLDGRKVALAQRLIALRGKKNILANDFLRYALQSKPVQEELRSRQSGTTVTGIKQSELRKISLPLPPLKEQQGISKILKSLDDKIELNRQMNQTLEQMTQAVFKHWFIEKSQDKDDVNIEEYIEFDPKISLNKGDACPYVDMKSLSLSGMGISNVVRRPFVGGSKFQNNDTLLARITPCLENGKTGFVNFLNSDFLIASGSTEFIVMRAKKDISPQFVYCLARDNSFRTHAISSMVGSSGRQRVHLDMLKKYSIKKNGKDWMGKFHQITKPLFLMVNAQSREIEILSQIRDFLLPKLMAGQIRVAP